MKPSTLLTLLLLAATAAPVALAAQPQPGAASEAVVLTNLDDGDSSLPASPQAAPATPAAPVAKSADAPRSSANRRNLATARARAKAAAGESEDETAQGSGDESLQEAERSSTPDGADNAPERSLATEDKDKPQRASSYEQAASGYVGSGAMAYGSENGSSYSGTSAATGNTGSASNSSASNSASGSSGGSGGGTLPRASGSGVIANTGGVDPSLASTLAQYRALMLQEANYGSLANTNPSTSRRYLAVDRSTYQARIGQ